MSEERQRVLRMLKEGKVTVEEAEALLEALGEAEAPEPVGAGPAASGGEAGQPRAEAVPGVPRGEGQTSRPDAGERPDDRRGDFQRMIDDIMKSVDVDGIRETVRESLQRSKINMDRVKEEVLRATARVRDESRRAAREYRRHGWGHHISRTIEGLWGLTPATGSWSHEADLASGRRLTIHNVWGDVRLRASADGRLRAAAITRAWGRDEEEARYLLETIAITATDEGVSLIIRVSPPPGEFHRRFRVDFDVQVPTGVPVEVAQAKGDVAATGLGGALTARAASGDVSVREHEGSVQVEVAKGDVTVHQAAGDVRVTSKHGDVTLAGVGGGATVHLMHGDIEASAIKGAVDLHTMHGDVEVEAVAGRIRASSKNGDLELKRPAGPVSFELETAHGDIRVEVERFQPGSASRMSTMSGDLSARLGDQARCRLSARVTSGEIQTNLGLADLRRNRRSLEGVLGSADSSLEMSTVSGDVSVEGPKSGAGAPASAGAGSG